MSIYLGIDPGVSGGMVAIMEDDSDPLARQRVFIQPCDKLTLPERWKWIRQWQGLLPRACIEKVTGYVAPSRKVESGTQIEANGKPVEEGQDQKEQKQEPGSRMFTFGRSFGESLAMLTAAEIPFEEVVAQTWQKAIGMSRKKGEEKSAWKRRLVEKAQQLFPSVAKFLTTHTADALLIANYCRMKEHGLIKEVKEKKRELLTEVKRLRAMEKDKRSRDKKAKESR